MKITSILASFAVLAGTALLGSALAHPTPSAPAHGGRVEIGMPAPSFSATDSLGNAIKLDSLRGKYVVLEWSNFTCPYVRKHYTSHNMQNLQKKYTAKGVVWLTIFSSAPGNAGYFPADQLTKYGKQWGTASTLVPDPDGTLGKLYGAKNTPTMFIIDPTGKTVYMGGIDDKATPDPSDIPSSKNYVASALDEALAGKPVTVPTSRPYGCGIHYAN